MSEWQPIETAPKDGTRIEVGHTAAPGYVGTAEWAAVRWSCSIAFPDMKLRLLHWQPNIWRPAPPPKET